MYNKKNFEVTPLESEVEIQFRSVGIVIEKSLSYNPERFFSFQV